MTSLGSSVGAACEKGSEAPLFPPPPPPIKPPIKPPKPPDPPPPNNPLIIFIIGLEAADSCCAFLKLSLLAAAFWNCFINSGSLFNISSAPGILEFFNDACWKWNIKPLPANKPNNLNSGAIFTFPRYLSCNSSNTSSYSSTSSYTLSDQPSNLISKGSNLEFNISTIFVNTTKPLRYVLIALSVSLWFLILSYSHFISFKSLFKLNFLTGIPFFSSLSN